MSNSNNSGRINQLRQNISALEGEMKGLNEQLDLNPEDLLPSSDILDSIQDIQIFDYEKELQNIKEDSAVTLECLSSLYLNADDIEIKNLSNIISNDASALADLQFTISCSKRGLVSLMKSIDSGITDPELFKSLALVQKEIRDTIKMSYDLQKKMKDFYKGIRDELAEINTIDVDEVDNDDYVETQDSDNELHIIDYDKLTEQIDEFQKSIKNQ